ncbi:type I polyketide synthase [Methylococcus geothermalis]|uniref:SDR family NAD(P)-dependent oxidoreductase n=1 Tax=Methylococcus geothermalis TaxID=2681310 RepID=A0A858QA12_9GAMM|nr:type I polyketide synthase [Methylococcus geothermalis]QJD30595.1 SDR family NAD(P)-dependent oxidoreductase [Methylococcus geothermalis]
MEKVIAITPPHCTRPEMVIAACRAGGIGVVDLGYRDIFDWSVANLGRIESSVDRTSLWGVRWDTLGLPQRSPELLLKLFRRSRPVPILVLAGQQPAEFPRFRELTRRIARQAFVEVHDLESARSAIAAGYDGLIVKGHEAGGLVSKHSTFILLQELHGKLNAPYWVQGGIGPRSAAAAILAGARGVVLCEQLWLADESPFSRTDMRNAWSRLDGSETILLGPDDVPYRLFSRWGRGKLRELEQRILHGEPWRERLSQYLGEADDPLLPLGQDITFAAPLAKRYGTVGRIVTAIRNDMESTVRLARSQRVFSPESPLARSHGTRYPIVQGPMTRVSDTAAFAKAVADGGALPFLALSVMRKPQVRELLTETRSLLGEQPWGVGLLGFMPLEFRQEQIEVIREIKPPFAIIAGGRPSQARELEELSIATYLHVPSPGLLHGFLKEGARKFIFEGSECGGHTGPRTSFILWESAIEILLTAEIPDAESVHVLFAGGIHDAVSTAMLSVLAAPLVARGMKVGILMGTAYLFTEEIVRTGAIVEEFQAHAVTCKETVLLQSGVGVYTRCAKTDFCDEFNRKRRELLLAQESDDDILKSLEMLNIGRLRIASKGITRNDLDPTAKSSGDRYFKVDVATQRREGMYMLGEVARLRNSTLKIAELHQSVSEGSGEVLVHANENERQRPMRAGRGVTQRDIAIIGMACLLPKAQNLRTYWQNIINRVEAIREVSEDRWRPIDFFDPRRGIKDKIYSKWGGFLDDIQFDPTAWGIPPASLKAIEPMQLLALVVARQALEDAALERRPFARERTATIFGAGGMHDLGTLYIFRTLLAQYLPKVPGLPESTRQHIIKSLYEKELPVWTEDSFPGFLGNVVAGRVANRLDLGGTNFTVDAACASSLAALDAGIRQLRDGDADVALVGAVDGTNNSTSFMAFAQTHALSPRGRCRPFDDSADGIAIGEGVVALVLKRLADAERDGDRIRGIIKGIGSSADGRNRSLTAPHPQGQARALHRAYEDAGVEPSTVTLIEAHGTGTAVGDKSEIETLNTVFGESGAEPQTCAVGSVKSMIGHTKVTSGLAALAKATLALEHRVLPPTLGVEKPNASVDFAHSPFYICTEPRPWLAPPKGHPRRCGVSAFGFGGTNFHVVLEEYTRGYRDTDTVDLNPRDAEPFAFWGADRKHIEQTLRCLLEGLEHPDYLDFGQLAHAVHLEQQRIPSSDRKCRLALVATSTIDLRQKLELALRALADNGKTEFKYPQGIYFRENIDPMAVCFLFPGQGSQKINMLRDLILARPALHELFERADRLLADRLPQPLSRYIYPLPVFSDEERARQQTALNATQIAQPALGVVELAAARLLESFGIRPDFVAGHSYGEYVALCAAGGVNPDDLIRLSEIRGRIAANAGRESGGAMAAVSGDGPGTEALIAKHGLPVHIANFNTPDQTIIAGPSAAIDQAVAVLSGGSLRVTKLQVSGAFHCPMMSDARDALAAELSRIKFTTPTIPVYSNTTAGRYPDKPGDVCALLTRHIVEPVRFVEEVNHLYEAGARVFIEVGPGSVLTGIVDRILAERPHTALGIDAPGRPGWLQLAHAMTHLFTLGVPVTFQTWFQGRGFKDFAPADSFAEAERKAHPGPLTWRINGGRAAPWEIKTDKADGIQDTVPLSLPEQGAALDAPAPAKTVGPEHQENRILAPNQRSNIMNTTEMTHWTETTEHASPPPAVPPPAVSDARLAFVQQSLAQFIDLQKEQQQTLRHFLSFLHANLAGTELPLQGWQTESQAIAPQPLQTQAVPPSPPRGVVLAAVPPAPVLPNQILAASGPVTPSAPIVQNASVRPQESASKAHNVVPLPNAFPPQAAKAGGNLAPTEQFKADLLRAIAERTGYPEEMLDLDAHMEADLGIDSIKRIEVFSMLKDQHNLLEGRDEETVIEELSGLKTLNEIIAWYDRLRESGSEAKEGGIPSPKKSQTPPSVSPVETAESRPTAYEPADPVRCYALKPVPAPWNGTLTGFCELPLLLLGPAGEVTETFRQTLADEGHTVWRIVPGQETVSREDGLFEVDFTSPNTVEKLKALVANTGKTPGGLINVLGVATPDDSLGGRTDPARILFLTMKALGSSLEEGVSAGGGWLVNVTAMDGQFGLGGTGIFSVGGAGSHGVAKSAAREWPQLRLKCVDLQTALSPSQWAENLVMELHCGDSAPEVGFTTSGRWRLELESYDSESGLSGPELEPGAVILAMGGAQGITSDIVKFMAQRYQAQFVLVGRTHLPKEEGESTRHITDPGELRQFLIGEQKAKSEHKVKPAEVEAELKRILKIRELRGNLDFLKEAGVKVEYHAVDVRDAEMFGQLIDDLYARLGRIDGVLHGAGIIEDKLVRDKSEASFDAVYQTKVVPALTLERKLRFESLKFLVFFSSVAGRFGNIGQCDYSAANEVLNKLADRLSLEWPNVHTVSINWGPWDSGMVNDELRRLYATRNIHLIPVATGTRRFMEALGNPPGQAPELVITASLDSIAAVNRKTKLRENIPKDLTPC